MKIQFAYRAISEPYSAEQNLTGAVTANVTSLPLLQLAERCADRIRPMTELMREDLHTADIFPEIAIVRTEISRTNPYLEAKQARRSSFRI